MSDSRTLVISGCLVVLTGLSRATEFFEVIIEPMSAAKAGPLVEPVNDRGYRGMAMPLDDLYVMVSQGDRIRIANGDEHYPNFELWFAANDIGRTALEHAITAELGDCQLSISPFELRLAYKPRLAVITPPDVARPPSGRRR